MQTASLRSRSFLSRYLTLFVGETFSKLCVLAVFAYLTRVLAPADYGIVELALSVTVFFVLGVEGGMGLYGARIVAAAPERVPQLVPEVMVLRGLLGLPAFAIILAAAYAYRSSGLGILAINGLAVLLTPFLTHWVFQGLRQMQWVAAGTAARNFTFVALVLLLVRPGSDIRLVAVAEVLGITALVALNAYFLHWRLKVSLNWSDLIPGTRRLFGEVWFMGLSDFTWACLWYSPALLLGWMDLAETQQVAWIGSAVRIVLALHTFVFLYFFNLLPNLSRELAVNVESWRGLMVRSLRLSSWPAVLLAVGGTLIAPMLIPAIYGTVYASAVLPFQIAIWMIPVTWFSGHFRFSLIAAGQQRWEFAVSAATAAVTVGCGLVLGKAFGSPGAAAALLIGGTANTLLAVAACGRHVAHIPVGEGFGAVAGTAAVSLSAGLAIAWVSGPLAGAVTGSSIVVVAAAINSPDLLQLARGGLRRS